ncbi:MAG: hypothetical protein PHI68_02845 [Candidatus Cloacimonetes bacterium]|nr:hypothetical protein [Candidatus Cloacimonadota bacterium]
MNKSMSLVIIILASLTLLAGTGVDPIPGLDIFSPELLSSLSVNTQELNQRAQEFYQAAEFETAARYYIAIIKARPNDASTLYNLSCCYGLLGKESLAAQTLLMAYRAGFTDLDHIMGDPDFGKVKDGSVFSAALDSLATWNARKQKAEGKLEYYGLKTYLPYRIYFPENFQPGEFHSLLIGLHGYGDNALAFGGVSALLKDKPIIYVVPEAPYLLSIDDYKGFSWSPSLDYEDPLQEASFMGLREGIDSLVKDLKDKFWIDKTILFGFSQGCFMTYNIGLANPELYNGLLAFGGWLEPGIIGEKQLEKAKSTRVYIAHGKGDSIVKPESATQALKILQDMDYDVQLESFEDGHRIDKKVFMAGLDWLLK